MMSKKVIFHIGFGKTGTSSIQAMLFKHRGKLEELGVLYPETGIYDNAHHHLADYKVADLGRSVIKLYNKVVDDFISSDCDTLLLSSEQFCFCKPGYIERLVNIFDGMNCEILFYVRRQEDLIPSTFMEKVKAGNNDQFGGDFEFFLRNNMKSFDFNIRIKPWASFFGDNSINVRPYKGGKGYDVCKEFLKTIGVNENLSTDKVSRENTSLLPEFLDLIKVVDQHNVSSACRQDVIKSLLGLSEKFRGASRHSFLSEDVVSRIKAYYEDSNKVFAEKYMSDDKGFLLSDLSGLNKEN